MQETLWNELIKGVQKPSRYLGTEWNAVHKEWDANQARMVFVYPDLYEVGMSHLGLAILYGAVNAQPGMLMERSFAPGKDMEKLLRGKGLPLFSLESRRPLTDFDIIGFTLQYELSYTTVLNILDLAGVPLLAEERKGSHPLVVGGGPGAANPEPVAPFFDCFLLGDGEEAVIELMALTAQMKEEGKFHDRGQILQRLAVLPGFYVPSLYKAEYSEDGRIASVFPVKAGIPERIQKRVVKDLDQAYFPERPIVPFMEVIHDRIMLEVMRGCTHGCRFCQAGTIYRPVRERDMAVLKRQAEELVRNTGHEEISLTSLSTADYSRIEELACALAECYAGQGVGVSLPSLRVDAFSVRLAEAVQRVRKSTLTFAPEAGTQRLRDIINKDVGEEDIFTAVGEAFQSGWQAVKLYFMLGLPGETEEDLMGIVDLARRILTLGRELAPGKKPTITVSVSTFVPKAQTVFQWEPQDRQEIIREKQNLLRPHLKGPGLRYNYHHPAASFIEAVLARGDRRLAPVITAAWRRGANLEGWSENFEYAYWQQAFVEVGMDPGFYAYRPRPENEVFPWDHLDFGLDREYLLKERQKAFAGEITADCRKGNCIRCGVCPALNVKPDIKERSRDVAVEA